jgi:hypothetical protein
MEARKINKERKRGKRMGAGKKTNRKRKKIRKIMKSSRGVGLDGDE